jgi:deoxyribonuclease IV
MAAGGQRSDPLVFGTGGVPHSAAGDDPASGIARVGELGLGVMELEFVHGVRMNDQMVERVRETAARLGVALTCHGPYYVNLASLEADKRDASVRRILETARMAQRVGARSITFHAAFYMKQPPASVHAIVRDALRQISATLRGEGNAVAIRPELTGKPSQYGDLEELLALSAEVEGVRPCIDFSHYHARTGGAQNSLPEFQATLRRYAEVLGKDALRDLHLHISGIQYTAKGEREHLDLADSDLKYPELLRALKQAGAGGVVICESPSLEQDALLLQRTYRKVRAARGNKS